MNLPKKQKGTFWELGLSASTVFSVSQLLLLGPVFLLWCGLCRIVHGESVPHFFWGRAHKI